MGLVRDKIANSLLGFSAGLPFLFTLSVFQAVLVDEGISIETIGMLGLVQLPYSLKFLWAWIFDRFSLLRTNTKNEWLFFVQTLLVLNFVFLGTVDSITLKILGFFILGFLSASQDILIDLFRIETSEDSEIGINSSLYVLFYRLALVLVGSIGFIVIEYYGFELMVKAFSFLMIFGFVGTALLPPVVKKVDQFEIEYSKVLNSTFLLLIGFLVFYKLGDTFADKLNIVYFLELGYSKADLGVVKGLTSWAVVLGGVISGASLKRITLKQALYLFGVLQIVSTFALTFLPFLPTSYWSLGAIWSFEKLTAGMGSVVLITFMSIKSKELKFTSFYYALFTSVIAFSLTTLSSISGVMVEALDWQGFLFVCCILSLPGMFLIHKVLDK